MEVSGELHVPGRFTTEEGASGTHLVGGWVDPRAGLEMVAKMKHPCLQNIQLLL
jgi:hypothetical protein